MKAAARGGLLLWGFMLSASAQQGVPAAPAAAQGAATATVQTTTVAVPASKEIEDQKVNRPSNIGAGGTRRPMDIRLHEGGVKLPKCTEESREGLACK